jgi:hypothetical protein
LGRRDYIKARRGGAPCAGSKALMQQ